MPRHRPSVGATRCELAAVGTRSRSRLSSPDFHGAALPHPTSGTSSPSPRDAPAPTNRTLVLSSSFPPLLAAGCRRRDSPSPATLRRIRAVGSLSLVFLVVPVCSSSPLAVAWCPGETAAVRRLFSRLLLPPPASVHRSARSASSRPGQKTVAASSVPSLRALGPRRALAAARGPTVSWSTVLKRERRQTLAPAPVRPFPVPSS